MSTWLYMVQLVLPLIIALLIYSAYQQKDPRKKAKSFALFNLTLGIFLFTMGVAKVTPETKFEELPFLTFLLLIFGFVNFFLGAFLLYRSNNVTATEEVVERKSNFPNKKKKKRK